jgi:glycosyltransferase involved in cell wall biosynthesis
VLGGIHKVQFRVLNGSGRLVFGLRLASVRILMKNIASLRMKILVSAIACNPYAGSELYFGWAAVKALACDHELWVLTSSRDRPVLERAATEGLVPPNVHFVYPDVAAPWHPNRMLARLQSWKEYAVFLKASLPVARQLHQIHKFDVVHHVTYTTMRVALPFGELEIPFVIGPICGNETFPLRLFPILSPSGAAFELARKTSNLISRFSPKVRQSIRRATHVFAITQEAVQLTKSMRGSGDNITLLSPGFYTAAKVAEFSRFVSTKNVNGTLRLYAAGNLGGQKCIALAFQALARVKKMGVDFRYHLGAKGPEIPHLKRLAAKLGLNQEIIFGDTMSREAYQQELGNSHIYLLPSMRETVGLTMMEAMLAGCVPIVGDNGGPRIAVTPECGYKIAVSTANRMAEEIANIVVAIDRNRKIISEKGVTASSRISEQFTEDHYRRTVNAVYELVAGRKYSMSS